MSKFPGAPDAAGFPDAADPARAAVGRERWRDAAAATGDAALAALVAEILEDADAGRAVDALFGNSAFLTHCAERAPEVLGDLLGRGPDAAWRDLEGRLARIRAAADAGTDPAAPLRVEKCRLALIVGYADIGGLWALEAVTGALSAFAEAALDAAAAFLLVEGHKAGSWVLPSPADPTYGSGLIVLGMGKLGAGELNYSSDVDLIVLFDPERIVTPDPDDLQHRFVRLTRRLVRLMEERTVDGYVFRTDLRLRPDPGATPPALSTLAALTYYESLGQNWERAAMIKARPVAGDREAGAEFLRQLAPFVWRKNLDFAAIQDIHSIKRQIDAHRGGGTIAIAGHNLKLGRGGIRELEFFAQTQQLVWGGRIDGVRCPDTVGALAALAEHGKLSADAARDLADAYRFLRGIEHRVQMVDDEQTHALPEDEAGLDALAVFLGYPDRVAFGEDLIRRMRRVEGHYAHLFEDAPTLSADGPGGNLVFTGSDPDPETLRTIEGLGFANAGAVDSAIRGWHHGRYRAMRSARARELMTELIPVLLAALGRTPDPDAAFLTFDRFLAALPAGVQLLSMLYSNPHVLEFIAEIMGGAPGLAEVLARRPSVLDSVLGPDFQEPPPPREALAAELDEALGRGRDFEDVLDISRRWANDRKFQAGVQCLRGVLPTSAAARAFSDIADVAIGRLLGRVEAAFAETHGRVPGCGMAVIAMGKLGGREMTATSDLDLIFVYTTPADGAVSDGSRPLPASQYFARLSQRLINAMTAPTAEGTMYEVDMRLRPSGKAGPIAVSFASFERYQREDAWTWERMALTRARPIAGPDDLVEALQPAIRAILTRPRDADALLADVAEMRARMADEHAADSVWEVKHLRGGLVDIEFIAQYLQLRHAAERPEVLSTSTADALGRLRSAGVLAAETAGELLRALDLWHAVQGRLRLALSGRVEAAGAADTPRAVPPALAGIGGCGSADELERRVRETATAAHGIYEALIEAPAAALKRAAVGAGEPASR